MENRWAPSPPGFLKVTAATALAAGCSAQPRGAGGAGTAGRGFERAEYPVFLTDDHGQSAQPAYGNSEIHAPNPGSSGPTRRADDPGVHPLPRMLAGAGIVLHGADAFTAWDS